VMSRLYPPYTNGVGGCVYFHPWSYPSHQTQANKMTINNVASGLVGPHSAVWGFTLNLLVV
jgi:hypothetical protein